MLRLLELTREGMRMERTLNGVMAGCMHMAGRKYPLLVWNWKLAHDHEYKIR
jgi:hypothetical protein